MPPFRSVHNEATGELGPDHPMMQREKEGGKKRVRIMIVGGQPSNLPCTLGRLHGASWYCQQPWQMTHWADTFSSWFTRCYAGHSVGKLSVSMKRKLIMKEAGGKNKTAMISAFYIPRPPVLDKCRPLAHSQVSWEGVQEEEELQHSDKWAHNAPASSRSHCVWFSARPHSGLRTEIFSLSRHMLLLSTPLVAPTQVTYSQVPSRLYPFCWLSQGVAVHKRQ